MPFFLPFHCRRVQSLTWPKQPVTTASHSAGSAILLWVLAEAASDEGQSHGRVSHGAVGNSTTCSTSCSTWQGNMRPADFSHIGNSLLPGSHDAPDSAALLHDAVRHASASLASIPNPAVGSAILGPPHPPPARPQQPVPALQAGWLAVRPGSTAAGSTTQRRLVATAAASPDFASL